MKQLLLAGGGLVGAVALLELISSVYFYRRTMMRSKAKVERTVKMAGTDWEQHMDFIRARKDAMMKYPQEEVWITSEDGLKLHGTYFPNGDAKKTVICFHGYTGQGPRDFIGLTGYYLPRGFGMLLVDERAHGESEGKYIGFGCLDRRDALGWIRWIMNRQGDEAELLLHGISMGGATVLMAGGLGLPCQVKGLISDCAFTSPKDVFSHLLRTMYHMPAFPMIQITDLLNRWNAGYGLDECNAAREIQKTKLPVLLIHGDADTFVPPYMCEEIYKNCHSEKRKLIIPGAAHAECYYKDTEAYERALDELIGGIIK